MRTGEGVAREFELFKDVIITVNLCYNVVGVGIIALSYRAI